MDNNELLYVLNTQYQLDFTKIELLREGGNATYAVWSEQGKHFLRCVGQAFSETIRDSIAVYLYLQGKDFSVPRLITTSKNDSPFVEYNDKLLVLYEFLEATKIDMDRDAEEAGALIGRLHQLMDGYTDALVTRDEWFYIGRYIEIQKQKGYSRVQAFIDYGERLWSRVKGLKYGYSHGDMYCGNIVRGANGRLYVLDFDTSCIGFPLYDLALICNQTDYFNYDTEGLSKSIAVYKRLLPEYLKYHSLPEYDVRSVCDMIALYHFALQATIIEIYGIDCVDNAFFDRQLSWLAQWEAQRQIEAEM